MDNLDIRVGQKYRLVQKLGSGSFGQVYLGRDIDTGEEVAIKLEHYDVAPSLLDDEEEVYQSLSGQPGFPRVHWHGQQDGYTILVFELLGPNLEDLLQYCGKRFSLKTTLMLADQLLLRLEKLHSHNYLHRDIKPENFLLGVGRQGNVVYMTDLGLVAYREPEQGSAKVDANPSHTPRLLGTCRYASVNGHLGVAQSRCDDLEALGYMLVYFLRGKLPWQGLKTPKGEAKYLRVLEMKQETSIENLCAGLPVEFANYMHYIHDLRDTERPDYKFLRKAFSRLFQQQGFEYDNVFDWTVRHFQEYETDKHQQLAPKEEVIRSSSKVLPRHAFKDSTKATRRKLRHRRGKA